MTKKLIVLSGLSGSGNSSVIKELLDLNYFVLTSLKTQKYLDIIDVILNNSENDKIAIFLNIDENFESIYSDIKKIKSRPNLEYSQIFLKSKKEILINRYQENRKVHPLIKNVFYNSKDKPMSILECIEWEIDKSQKFIEQSDYVIDTSSLFTKQLIKVFKSYINETSNFTINLFSFGFKYGLYQYSDFVFDTRFLKNPYYKEDLRMKSGEDKVVSDFVFQDESAKVFLKHILDIVNIVAPRYIEVDKASVSISIGCTGGQHRSVAFVEEIYKTLSQTYEVNKIHIEKEKGNWQW